MDEINLVMCIDHDFVVPLAVALASLDSVSKADSVHVHVLHPGIKADTRNRVLSGLSAIQVSWLSLDDTSVRGAFYSEFLSSASLFRLLLDDLLPPYIQRVIYLDADTLVVNSLASLYHTELDQKIIGAIQDANSPWAAGALGPNWRELGLEPSLHYFNSGVLLIDIERWRQEAVGSRCLELLRKYRPRWGDQDALNTILAGKWLELPLRWNIQTGYLTGDSPGWALWRSDVESAITDPAIIHYTERDKPWHFSSEHPRTEEWFSWLDTTAWSGWRPSPPKESRLESLTRYAMRSARRWRKRRNSGGLPS
jgi:lipopolysaccharide biosynthesis glycosyltransferase